MSLGRTRSVTLRGIDGTVVDVEANASQGLPAFTITGMPDAACRQSPERIRAACGNSELELPSGRITVNLSPAALPKHGSGFDLAIAVAALAATGAVDGEVVRDIVHLGELALDGSIRPVHGVLPAVLAAVAAGVTHVVVPAANAAEAALVPGVLVTPMRTLPELVARYDLVRKRRPLPDLSIDPPSAAAARPLPDLCDVSGQEEARHALEVAAAGGHHMAMIGPPGAGKTMIAERLPGILPPLERAEALEVTAIHSVLGALGAEVLIERAPFVAPHHGASMAAVIGGGSGPIRPGAVSRAHRGVLFLDESPEFRRDVLDALRQPLEAGRVTIARADRVATYPARFQLVLAANPCPCGKNFGKGGACSCSVLMRRGYLNKLSGPLMDRVDVHLQVAPVTRAGLAGPGGEPSAAVAARVVRARERQARRWHGCGWLINGTAPGPALRGRWRLPRETTGVLDRALETGTLTMRGYDRCLRVGWTLADLQELDAPGPEHLLRALALRTSQAAA
ncbi:YifB family Mg chelatase-like AAA ATPase [Allobranchiibius sp. GilTou73]|uniref:YifB family Mg chelatase-like AAA ATPase n=1 Tax=Allobranchiibius sp. GilTou73 TaxID=2904523 RepID=UPI001F290FDA|nr:YifB family Mg chelatase-like AAA ATPase [Allobranchiibius sp. GilTou73]UIJ34465.1 YifB family Mg chelatase-like AAA ATPase [Allobranchiibius sp. GilTou73]